MSALSLCPRPWVGESCTCNGWVLKKFSQEMPQPSIDHASVRDNLGQASQDPSKVPHWVQAAQACPPLFADLSLLSQHRGRSADCELWARARKGTERDLSWSRVMVICPGHGPGVPGVRPGENGNLLLPVSLPLIRNE